MRLMARKQLIIVMTDNDNRVVNARRIRPRGGPGQAARGAGEEVPDVVGDPGEGEGGAR